MSEIKKEDELSLEKEFDLRERRLKLIYKILYVVAIGVGAVFVAFAEQAIETKPIYCGVLSVLVSFLINLLNFIFSEFRCIKVFGKVEDKTKNDAEFRFSYIWNSLAWSSFVSLAFTFANMLIIEYGTVPINNWFVTIPMGVALASLLIVTFFYNHNTKIKEVVKSIAIPVICYCIFAFVQTAEVV